MKKFCERGTKRGTCTTFVPRQKPSVFNGLKVGVGLWDMWDKKIHYIEKFF